MYTALDFFISPRIQFARDALLSSVQINSNHLQVKRDPQSTCGLYGQDSRAISTG